MHAAVGHGPRFLRELSFLPRSGSKRIYHCMKHGVRLCPGTSTMNRKDRVFASVDLAVADVPDGATVMFGGFGGAGFPNNLIQGLARRGARNLRVISNNCGTGDGELQLAV